MNTVDICMITDNNYIVPTTVAIQSIIDSKNEDSFYEVYLVTSNLNIDYQNHFLSLQTDSVKIHVIQENAESRFEGYHVFDEKSICAASIAALIKFLLPDLLNLDRVLYLDGDIIVKEDLTTLFNIKIQEKDYLAAAIDSGTIYYKHKYVHYVEKYFNSGVMVLNLEKIRRDQLVPVLLKTKKELDDSSLMDQTVFNLVFDKKFTILPIRHNFMPVNLYRSYEKWTITQVNEVYGTEYKDKGALFSNPAIIHYSSKDKPWKDLEGAFASEWITEYLRAPLEHDLIPPANAPVPNICISVIIPCYNTESYIAYTLDSILTQSFRNLEVICLDDGSTDETAEIIRQYVKRDARVILYQNKNHGPGYQRNRGIDLARGKYIHFIDSDDWIIPDTYEILYTLLEENRLDVVFFEGNSVFDSEDIEKRYEIYHDFYHRKEAYPKLYNGKEFYLSTKAMRDYFVQPCMFISRTELLRKNDIRFPDTRAHEDNLFTLKLHLFANRIKCLGNAFYCRRVRENSIMTSSTSAGRCYSWIEIIK